MYLIKEFIQQYDKDGKITNAISECLTENMTTELALDTLTYDLQKHLSLYFCEKYAINMDETMCADLTNEIKHVLSTYFEMLKNNTPAYQSIITPQDTPFDKCVVVPRFHLTSDTLEKYIDTNTVRLPDEVSGGKLEDNTYAIRIYTDEPFVTNPIFKFHSAIPTDLLMLLNWAITNNVAVLILSEPTTDRYADWDELMSAAKITGLPLYDITEKDFEQ